MNRCSLLLLMLVACGPESRSSETGADNAVTDAGSQPTVSVLGVSQQAGWEEAVDVIIANEASWAAAWTYQHDGITPSPQRPSVNFEAERVLMIAAGVRPSGGFALELTDHAIVGDTLTIDILLSTPGAECGVATALTSPALALRIPIRPETVVVRRTERAVDCTP